MRAARPACALRAIPAVSTLSALSPVSTLRALFALSARTSQLRAADLPLPAIIVEQQLAQPTAGSLQQQLIEQ